MHDYIVLIDEQGSPYLAHHGILGQKWGVRRFQNRDGTWTSKGKLRYGSQNATNNSQEVLNTKLDDIHDKDGSIGREVALLAANVVIDALTLNPIGAVQDAGRIAGAISAHIGEKRAEKRKAKATIDEKTGLPLKSKETTAEMDLKMTNPGYRNFNTNTKNNCVLCSTAFELRRRGYDVTAAKAGVGYSADEYLKWFKGAKLETRDGESLKAQIGVPTIQKTKALYDWANPKLLAQGDGARGYLSVVWGAGGGHSMAYEIKNGQVVVYDAQCGKKKSLRSVTAASVDIGFTRLDNLEPNYDEMKKAGVI